ncbi:MAG: fumarylacetoacetate hydrolase family protein, partial [Rhizobiaceae bacterium]|nr:fumarylacetoacetate hydrolase family protein [Rhizobiaceae bacterium]
MKFVRYGERGRERPGVLDGAGGIRDLSAHVDDIAGPVLGTAQMQRLHALDVEALPKVSGEPRLGPCVGHVGNFIAVGLNYADHAAEGGDPIPPEPILFNKARSSVSGPNDDVIQPRGSTKLDWEVELAIVIGERLSYAHEDEGWNGIAGFCICHDVSERAFQLERGGTWSKGKGCPTFGPLGPWLVTPDEIADVQKLAIWLELNGKRVQNGNTSNMIFPVRHIVSYISQFMVLEPGDVITTGTPAGVGAGMNPERYLQPG